VAGLATAFGSGAMTNSIAEIEQADVILVTGSNTTENHPVISAFVKRAVIHNNAQLIVVDPRSIGLTGFAKHWLRQRPGTDVAWINGMLNVILSEGLQDQAFIDERTENFDALKKVVAEFTPERVEKITNIPAQELIAAARAYGNASKATILYAMGITQHTNGTDNVKALANLAMATGNIGRPSTGVNPLRGQNNVQGACDMGALPNVYPGYQTVIDPGNRKKFESAWGKRLSDKVGLTVTEMMPGILDGNVKGMFILGENPILSDPDSNHVEKALKKCEFLVVQDIFMTETARLAHVVLPAACFAEKDGTFANTERRVCRVRKAVDPPGSARSDLDILVDMLERMGIGQSAKTAKAVFDELAALTPSYAGISYNRLTGDGIQWPCPTRKHPGTPYLHAGRFARGLGLFSAVAHQEPAEKPTKKYPYTLTTGRILYQYHTGTMTRRCEGLEYMAPNCLAEINPADALVIGLKEGDPVKLASRRGNITVVAHLTNRVPPKTVFVPFHYAEAVVNKLTNSAMDPIAKIPEYKVCAVSMERAA
jgi:formate dehydrogenase alpha subunit